ncbi:DUF2268 domain-containing putative Zn-dependent protease [Spongiimicrobium sp. 2-473A-2-J]|uniref:DUF2268 domain-containing putative Zn-dependent protease n=1 Tax=Eudoraea algarum TaxID=3417568 RepID=UPI003D3643BA
MKKIFLLTVILFINLSVLSCSSGDDTENGGAETGIALPFESRLFFEDNGELDPERNAIETVIRETISLVNQKMSVENLNIRIKASPSNAIPEIGIGGFNPNAGEVILSIDPNFTNLAQSIATELGPLLAHEMHHAKRRRTVGYGSTLLEASVSEGLADCFAMEITGIDPPIWSVALTGSTLEEWIDIAGESWNDSSYNHARWFFGTSPDVPRWTGYSIGFKLVKDYIAANPTRKPSDLFNESASSFDQ